MQLYHLGGFLDKVKRTAMLFVTPRRKNSSQNQHKENSQTEILGEVIEPDYSLLADRLPTIFYTSKAEDPLSLLFISPSIQKILGYTHSELVNNPDLWKEIFHPEDRDRVVQAFSPASAASAPISIEYRIKAKDGRTVWFREYATLVEKDGLPPHVQGFLLDVTAEKKAEEAIRQSRDFHVSLLENYPALVWRTDINGHCDYVNQTWVDFTGRPVGDNPDEDWLDCIHPGDLNRVISTYRSAINQRVDFLIEYRLRTKTGQYRWIKEMGRPYNDLNGNYAGYIGAGFDIQDQKYAEAEMIRHARRAETLANYTEKLNASLNLNEHYQTILTTALKALSADAVSITLYDEHHETFHHAASLHLNAETAEKWAAVQKPYVEQAAASQNDILLISDPAALPASVFQIEGPNQAAPRLIAISALEIDHKIIGAVTWFSFEPVEIPNDVVELLRRLTNQAALAISKAQLFEETENRLKLLQSLRMIDRSISSNFDLRITLETVLAHVASFLNLDSAFIVTYEPSSSYVKVIASIGFSRIHIDGAVFPVFESVCGRVIIEREVIKVADLQNEKVSSQFASIISREGFQSAYAVPLITKGEVKGVLQVFFRKKFVPHKSWFEMLELFAGPAAIAVDNSALFEGLQRKNIELLQAYYETIEGWSHAMDMRDRETEGHTERVTQLTVEFARMQGIPEDQLLLIRYGALLHDMGKLGVPDEILLKPGTLTDEEWAIMRRHTEFAYEMLKDIKFLRPALDIPRYHHEKWDGTGYPFGLKGEEIPLPARMFALVDVWDALTNDRPYRQAWEPEQVIQYIRDNSGKHFDPNLVEPFIRLVTEH